ncbi:MAG TPA: VWA domain-containing protein [Bryobacteraceae bacterium]|nr:VWA domain-containing protein [Bryobacteraceae bacterium]
MRFVCLLALLPAIASALQEPVPILRSETRVVQIDVAVRDSRGLPVHGLSKEDFTVTDQGKLREIAIFSDNPNDQSDAQPLPPKPPPGVFSNRAPSSGSPEHVTVILLDGILGSFDDFRPAQMNIMNLMAKIPGTERIAIYAAYMASPSPYAPPVLAVIQDFTSDRDLLRKSIAAYRPPAAITPAPPRGAPAHAIQHMERIEAATGGAHRAIAKLNFLREIGKHLAVLPGRKSLIWITDGFPASALMTQAPVADKTIAALNDSNVALNPIHMHGVVPPSALGGIEELAKATGGQVYYRGNDIGGAVLHAVQASRSDYTLGFYLNDSERDGKFHQLAVRVDRPGVALHYRRGYIAETASAKLPSAKEDLDAARLNPVDANAIGISVRPEVVPGQPEVTLRLRMSIDSQGLSLQQDGEASAGKVEEKIVELDERGAILGQIEDTKLFRIPGNALERFYTAGVSWEQRMRMMPGAAAVRVIIRDSASGRVGSLNVPLPGNSGRTPPR